MTLIAASTPHTYQLEWEVAQVSEGCGVTGTECRHYWYDEHQVFGNFLNLTGVISHPRVVLCVPLFMSFNQHSIWRFHWCYLYTIVGIEGENQSRLNGNRNQTPRLETTLMNRVALTSSRPHFSPCSSLSLFSVWCLRLTGLSFTRSMSTEAGAVFSLPGFGQRRTKAA